MRAGTRVPGRVHEREEVRRNLLRFAGYLALLLDEPPVGSVHRGESVPGSPLERAYRLLAVNTLLFSTLPGESVAVRSEGRPEELVGYFLALLPGVVFPELAEAEARSVFLGHLAVAVEEAPPAPVAVGALHGVLRGRLFDLLHRLRAGRGGLAALPVALDVGARVYYLADALGLCSRLTPPAASPTRPTDATACPTTSRTTPASSPRRLTRSGSRSSPS